MWIGTDDTDSLQGGCTTYVATELILKFMENGYDLIGFPRLVRLNPNIPWKTRGNGAICLKVGKGGGKRIRIGEAEGNEIVSYSRMKSQGDIDEIVSMVDDVISQHIRKDADAAFVVSSRKFPYALYRKAVREIVEIEEIKKFLDENGIAHKYYRKGRGLIGASAAISWRPVDRTYELIAYGSSRWIDKESVIEMDRKCSSTFNNYDYRNDYIAILPKAKSPVFYGIRGDDAEELVKAREMLRKAEEERWIIFETNQGTDEHLQRKKIGEIKPYESVIVRGRVKKEPKDIKGGHVIFSIYDGEEMECAAYEPTKEFREVVRELKEGDEIVVYGGVREKPFTINIEKMEVKKLADVYEKIANPLCIKCGKRMKSMGRGKGYRCQRCGARANENEAVHRRIKRKIKPGFYEVPVIARRHLAKPLKRMAS